MPSYPLNLIISVSGSCDNTEKTPFVSDTKTTGNELKDVFIKMWGQRYFNQCRRLS